MSLHAMHWARQSMKRMPASVKAPSRLALMLLADYADEDHVSWPSLGTMAEEMGCSKRSVQRAIDLLEQHGLVDVEARLAANGRQQSNRYRLAVGGGCQSVTPSTSDQPGEGDNLSPSEGDKLTGRGDSPVRGRVTPVSPLESTTRTLPPNPDSLSGAGASIFERAAQQADDGTPPASQPRRYPMTLDWQPDPEQLAMACQRAGLPADTQPAPHQLAKFTAHHADTGRAHGAAAWHAKLTDWLRNDLRAAPTGGSAHGPAADQRRDDRTEREAVRQQLANPWDTSWADGWWPDEGDAAAQGAGAGAGEPDIHSAGGDISPDVFERVSECGSVEPEQARTGAGAGELAGAAVTACDRAHHERAEARGEYLAADDPGAGADAGASAGGFRHASDW